MLAQLAAEAGLKHKEDCPGALLSTFRKTLSHQAILQMISCNNCGVEASLGWWQEGDPI